MHVLPKKGWRPAEQQGWSPEGFWAGTEGMKEARKKSHKGTWFRASNFTAQFTPDTVGKVSDCMGSIMLLYYECSQKETEFGREQAWRTTKRSQSSNAGSQHSPRAPQMCHFHSRKANSGFTKPAAMPSTDKTKAKQIPEASPEQLMLLLDHQLGSHQHCQQRIGAWC